MTIKQAKECMVYIKDGHEYYVRFTMVHNLLALITYCNVWVNGEPIGQTYDCKYRDTREAIKSAQKILADNGYIAR